MTTSGGTSSGTSGVERHWDGDYPSATFCDIQIALQSDQNCRKASGNESGNAEDVNDNVESVKESAKKSPEEAPEQHVSRQNSKVIAVSLPWTMIPGPQRRQRRPPTSNK